MRASLSTLAIALTALLASTPQLAHAQDPQETLALYEPPDGKVMFGAWVQTECVNITHWMVLSVCVLLLYSLACSNAPR
jgi:hypothetical protein